MANLNSSVIFRLSMNFERNLILLQKVQSQYGIILGEYSIKKQYENHLFSKPNIYTVNVC